MRGRERAGKEKSGRSMPDVEWMQRLSARQQDKREIAQYHGHPVVPDELCTQKNECTGVSTDCMSALSYKRSDDSEELHELAPSISALDWDGIFVTFLVFHVTRYIA